MCLNTCSCLCYFFHSICSSFVWLSFIFYQHSYHLITIPLIIYLLSIHLSYRTLPSHSRTRARVCVCLCTYVNTNRIFKSFWSHKSTSIHQATWWLNTARIMPIIWLFKTVKNSIPEPRPMNKRTVLALHQVLLEHSRLISK